MGRSHLQPTKAHFLDIQLANGNGNGNGHYFPSPSQLLQLPPLISPLRLTPREDSTRVQLQRQRLKDQYATAAIVSKTIPGFKTSAAFFASLRTNLRLHASPPPSPWSTPPSMRSSFNSLPPPSPLAQAIDGSMDQGDRVPPEDPLADVPELKTYLTEDEDERIAAMKLVADSVAQMRQTANTALIFHPLNLAVMVAIVAVVARFVYNWRGDVVLAGMSSSGVIMAVMASYRFVSHDYIPAAEAINWEWLGDADVIVTKFGDEVIGTVMMDWVTGEKKRNKKAWKSEIKAWTVRLRYRGKGVGSSLLEEAVKEAKKNGAENIQFAEEHANFKRFLPGLYNSSFDKREAKARDLLADLLESSPGRGKRK